MSSFGLIREGELLCYNVLCNVIMIYGNIFVQVHIYFSSSVLVYCHGINLWKGGHSCKEAQSYFQQISLFLYCTRQSSSYSFKEPGSIYSLEGRRMTHFV